MTSPVVRPANPDDAARMKECALAAYGHYVERIGAPPRPMLEDYGQVIRQHQAVVAERDAEVAGFLVLGETPDGFRLMNIAVDPRHQKTGVGRALLRFAEEEARRRGHSSIYLSTHEKMTENQQHYAKIGYREFQRRTEADGHCRVYMRKSFA